MIVPARVLILQFLLCMGIGFVFSWVCFCFMLSSYLLVEVFSFLCFLSGCCCGGAVFRGWCVVFFSFVGFLPILGLGLLFFALVSFNLCSIFRD